jgi:hypothetical protein
VALLGASGGVTKAHVAVTIAKGTFVMMSPMPGL